MIPSLMQQKPECFSIRLLQQYDSSMSNIALNNCIYIQTYCYLRIRLDIREHHAIPRRFPVQMDKVQVPLILVQNVRNHLLLAVVH